MIRILVADDHSVVRKGIMQIVADCPDMEVDGEAATGDEALELVRSRSFDVVILDIAMPGRGGLDILREMKAEKSTLKVLILSMYSEEQYAIRCLRDGASAYLTKGSPPEESSRQSRPSRLGKGTLRHRSRTGSPPMSRTAPCNLRTKPSPTGK